MAVVVVLFDPRSGRVVAEDHTDVWKIIRENDGVSILDHESKLVGSGSWSGKGVRNRASGDDRIGDSLWAQIENAIRNGGKPAPLKAEPPRVATGSYRELIVELAESKVTWQSHEKSPSKRAANAFEWKVIVDGDRVTVHAHDAEAFARATWDGTSLSDHEVREKNVRDINDYQWSVVETAVRFALSGEEQPQPRRAVDGWNKDGSTPEPRAVAATSGSSGVGSGWWAFAAGGIALVATIVSWRVMHTGDSVALGATIGLGAVTVGLLIYGGYGLATRCPKCTSWYRRKTTGTTALGSSTYSKQISKDVTDSSGKKIGSTYETATYERTNYRYSYQCKHCSHSWTGTGSSERRIS